MTQGIDVSKHNGKVDWPTAKAAGLNFAMIRCGFGSDIKSQDDQQWERNVKECDRLGIPWGAYLYSYALNANDAKSELQHVLRLLKGKQPTYPVVIDMEDADGYKVNHGGIPSKSTNTAIIKTFCDGIKAAGYKPGYYCNRDWYSGMRVRASASRTYPATSGRTTSRRQAANGRALTFPAADVIPTSLTPTIRQPQRQLRRQTGRLTSLTRRAS